MYASVVRYDGKRRSESPTQDEDEVFSTVSRGNFDIITISRFDIDYVTRAYSASDYWKMNLYKAQELADKGAEVFWDEVTCMLARHPAVLISQSWGSRRLRRVDPELAVSAAVARQH